MKDWEKNFFLLLLTYVHAVYILSIELSKHNLKVLLSLMLKRLFSNFTKRSCLLQWLWECNRLNELPVIILMIAERLIDIWPHMLTMIQFWVKILKCRQSTCRIYKKVQNAVNDLDKFSFYFWDCQTALEKLKSDKQMLSLMYFELKSVIKALIKVIVNLDVLEKCKTSSNLNLLDLPRQENSLSPKDGGLGFLMNYREFGSTY